MQRVPDEGCRFPDLQTPKHKRLADRHILPEPCNPLRGRKVVNCPKRQRENYKGVIQHRCLHPTLSTLGQVVSDQTCTACPMRPQTQVETCSLPQLPVLNLPPCEWRFNNKHCTVTGLPITEKICNGCSQETARQEATMGDKMKNYYGAIRRWVASGMPVRSDSEVKAIFDDHCSKCELRDPATNGCKNCGCIVSTSSVPLGNKIKMKTEVCPLGRWS